jgi:hypothetical protein
VKIPKAGASPFLREFADLLLELTGHLGAVDREVQGAGQMQINESGFNQAVAADKCRDADPPIKQDENQVVPQASIAFCYRCGFPNSEQFCPRCGNRRCVTCGDGP